MIVVKKLLFAAVLGLVTAGVGVPATAQSGRVDLDAVRSWNERALNAVRATRASDADAARLYAMVDVAMYDAVNGIAGARTGPHRAPALVPGPGPRDGDEQAAAVAAAHAVLVRLDAARAADYDTALAADLARLGAGHGVTSGANWGGQVGERVVAARAGDGSTPFSLATDSAPGGAARSYPGFSAAATEAGRSRIFGGRHFEFSSQAGFAIGHGVAGETLALRLLRRTGPTHFGACPL